MNNKNITLESINDALNNRILPELMPINDYVKRKITNTQVIQDSI